MKRLFLRGVAPQWFAFSLLTSLVASLRGGAALAADAPNTPPADAANVSPPAPAPPPAAVVGAISAAKAQEVRPLYERPHTCAQIQLGLLALPGAPISPARVGGETPFGTVGSGDATMMVGLDFLYRGGREWDVGAAARFGPSPTTDDTYGAAGGLPRSHSRSYLLVGVEARYIPLHYRSFEGWVGGAAGAVVIADRYETKVGDVLPTVLGIRETTVSTEGLSLGVQTGANWNFAAEWVAGAALRLDSWFLPGTPACSAIGDCATLKDRVAAVQFGVSIGYRIPL
jgi:hypothetical protein